MGSILNAFKSKHPFLLAFLPFILLAFWYKWLQNPIINIDETSLMPLSLYLVVWLKDYPFCLGLLSIATSLSIAYFIYYLNDRYNVLKMGSSLPSFLYIVFVGCFPNTIAFNPAVFSALFVLIAFSRILYAYNSHNSISCFFDAGFFIGLASAFYFQSIFFVVFLLIAMASIGRFNLRELLAVMVGVLLPFVFMWTYYAYAENLPHFYDIIEKANVLIRIYEIPSVYELILLAYIGFLFIVSASSMFLRNPLTEVFDLKFFTVLFWVLLVCVFFPILFYPLGVEIISIAAIPLSFFIARFFIVQKHKFYGDILFILLLVFVVLLQFPDILNMISSLL